MNKRLRQKAFRDVDKIVSRGPLPGKDTSTLLRKILDLIKKLGK